MEAKLEEVYLVSREFLRKNPVQLAIDCNQTYVDESGVIRLDLESLFDPNCEEHEASMFRTDRYFGFEESKFVDSSLVEALMARNPTSNGILTREDIMEYQSERIMDSRMKNPETEFRDFDIGNMGAQMNFLFLVGGDPTLHAVEKDRLEFFVMNERFPDGFIPGALRETPYNFLDLTDMSHFMFVESMINVQNMMHNEIGDRESIRGDRQSIFQTNLHHGLGDVTVTSLRGADPDY
jgi:hypothetical protein